VPAAPLFDSRADSGRGGQFDVFEEKAVQHADRDNDIAAVAARHAGQVRYIVSGELLQ
jgi:hypothetical protein